MKNFKIIIALLMIICVMAVVCSCSKDEKHYHSYPAEWNSDVNNHWHVCTGEDCDNIVGITPHKFGEGVVTTPATEESDGLMTYKCSVCGFEKNEAIAKLPVGHKHELQQVDGVEPTCVDKGVETYYVCSCGMKFADEQGENEISYPVVIDEKGHTPVDFGEHVDPTCDTAGIEKGKKCSDCGIIITEEKMINPLGHIWNEGAITKPATCFSEGVKTLECTVCGAKKTEAVAIDANAHAWNDGVVTKAPTCNAEGVKTFRCQEALCGAEKTETVAIDANAHKWNEGSVTTAPTCTEKGVKSFECTHNSEHKKTEAVEINPEAHEWNDGVVTTDPTCTEVGEKTFTCKHNAEHTYTAPVDALGHDIVTDAAVAPKCTETGLTEGSHCSRCDEMTVAQNTVPATGHTYDNNQDESCNVCGEIRDVTCEHTNVIAIGEAKNPTCTEDGITAGEKCGDCGEIVTAQEIIPATGHTEVVDDAVAPKCDETGLTEGSHCSVCGTVLIAQETVDALGHSPKEDVVVENNVEPKCETAGSYDNVIYCSVCDAELNRETVTVDALGHTEEAIPGYAATCTVNGLSDGKRCVVCNTITVKQEEIETASHAWNGPVITIVENIGTSTYTCEICGATESKFGPVETVTEKHTCDHLVSGVETEFGKWTACSVCGAKSYAQTALSAYKGSGATHASVNVYLPKEGGDPTVAADMVKQEGVTVSDVAITYNITSGADKSKDYVEFTYTVTAESAMTVNVYFNGRSTNTYNNVNSAAQINKFMHLYQGNTEIAIPDSAVLPAYREGTPYWTEQQVATVELVEGVNTFTFRFTKEGGIYNKGKYYGAYASYFRFAEDSKELGGCENNVHALEKILEVAPTCLTDGMKAHYACADCGKLFDLENKVEIDAKYLAIPHWDHIFENIARKQEDGTYAYVCTRGCGTTRAHVCTGGTHLIIAKEPNQVWYEEGDTFNPDRMELYLSTACVEGCSGNTVVAGHLKGYDALTYTYQNGDSFKAGDEYITINYTVEGETYSVQLPVTVTAVGGTITIDNTYAGFAAVDNSTKETQNLDRKNDTGMVGQSAYGGSYANNFADGDVVTFTFTLGEAEENANIVLRAAQDRVNGAGGTPPYVSAVSVNDMITIKVDGVVVEFSDDVIFKGSVTNLDQKTNRWVWTNWMSLDLGTYSLDAGEHKVEIIYNNVLGGAVCCSDNSGREAAIQLDCLNVFLGE